MTRAASFRTLGVRGVLFRARIEANAAARMVVSVVSASPYNSVVVGARQERALPPPLMYAAGATAIVASSSTEAASASLGTLTGVVADPTSLSAAAVVAISGLDAGFPTWSPHAWLSYGMMKGMSETVNVMGVEWWVAIVAMSMALRPLTIPPALFAQRTGAMFGHYKAEMGVFSARIADANKKEDKPAASQAIADYRAFMKARGLNAFTGMLLPIVTQMFVFISMFSSIRWLIDDAALIPGFAEGGKGFGLALLTAPDPSYILPLVASLTTSVAIAINPNLVGMADRGLSAHGHRLAFSGVSFLLSGITVFFPAVRVFFLVEMAPWFRVKRANPRAAPHPPPGHSNAHSHLRIDLISTEYHATPKMVPKSCRFPINLSCTFCQCGRCSPRPRGRHFRREKTPPFNSRRPF